MFRKAVQSIFLSLCLSLTGFAQSPYSGITAPGAVKTSARGINLLGDIVGSYQTSAGATVGFVDKNGTFTTIAFPGAIATQANGINSGGDVVGDYLDSAFKVHGFLFSGAVYTAVNFLDPSCPQCSISDFTSARGINDTGTIVGTHANGAFSLSGGVFTRLNLPGPGDWLRMAAFGINNAGDIVGSYGANYGLLLRSPQYSGTLSDPPIKGFILSHSGTVTIIQYPGGGDTFLMGINNGGDIVGFHNTSQSGVLGSDSTAFTLRQGTFTTFYPFQTRGIAFGLNDAGDVVGNWNIVEDVIGISQLGIPNSQLFFTDTASFKFTGSGTPPEGQPPPPPVNLRAGQDTNIPQSQVDLYWDVTGSAQTGFQIFRSVDGGQTFTQVATVGAGVSTYQDPGLTPSTVYYYNVRAFNAAGISAPSNTDGTITAAGTGNTGGSAPAAPTNAAAGQDTGDPSTKINVYWVDNSNNEAGFQIFRSTDGVSFSQVGTAPASATAYQDGGLSPGTAYYYYVKAFNPAGTSAASNTDGTITAAGTGSTGGEAPAAPTNVAAGQDSGNPSTKINVYWVDNSNNEAGFQIFRSTDGLSFSQIGTAPASATVYQDGGLSPATAYYYYVKAFNPAGASAASNTDGTITAP